MAKPGEARAIISIFQQDRRTYQNLAVRPDTTARALCDRFDLVQLSRRELVRDGRSFGLFHLTVSGGESLVPDSELVTTFIRNCGEAKPKFAFLMRDSRDFLFLKEKNVSIDAAVPPSPKNATPAKDAQGWLRKKKEGKQWKKRWVKLTGTTLQYQKDPRVLHVAFVFSPLRLRSDLLKLLIVKQDREPLGSLPLGECSLSFKVLSGLRTIIIARFDKSKPNARPVVFLFCADKDSTGLTVDEWYASIYARITPLGGGQKNSPSGSLSPSGAGLSSPTMHTLATSSNNLNISTTIRREGVNLAMRERAMLCWVNTVCARKKIPVASLGTELDNGIILITIVELGFQQRVTARYATDITAMTWEQKVSNLNVGMEALRTAGARFSPINPQIFIDGNKQPILQFFWEVIISFHMRGATGGIKEALSEESYKRQLLEKVQNWIGITQEAQVTNFTSSFADGFAFCYIIERFKPAVIDFRDIVKEKPMENLTAAFTAASNAGMPPCLSIYGTNINEGFDELAVVVWLCIWLDLMDPVRKVFFEPLPMVPVSQRVLMDKLMDGKGNPREIMQVMREIRENEKDRKVYLSQKDKEEEERRKKEERARLRQETEAESVSNLQAIMTGVATKGGRGNEPPELDEEENFLRQQLIIKAQYEKYEAEQRRLQESERGSSIGGEAAANKPPGPIDDSMERRMLEEFGSDEEIYDVAAELQNLDTMMGELDNASSPVPAKHAAAAAQKEVDDLFSWEADEIPVSNSGSGKKAGGGTGERIAPDPRSTVDRVIDEQLSAIAAIRAQERTGVNPLASNAGIAAGGTSAGSPLVGERKSTATKAELESTVNEVEAFLTALTNRRNSSVAAAGPAKAAALAAAQANPSVGMVAPPMASSPMTSSPYLSSPQSIGSSNSSAMTMPLTSGSATSPYAYSAGTVPYTAPATATYGMRQSYAPVNPASSWASNPAATPAFPHAVAAQNGFQQQQPPSPGYRKGSNPFVDEDDDVSLQRTGLTSVGVPLKQQSFEVPPMAAVGMFFSQQQNSNNSSAASTPPALNSDRVPAASYNPTHNPNPNPNYPSPMGSTSAPASGLMSPPRVIFTAQSPPRSPEYVPPPASPPPPLPPFSGMPLSPLRNHPASPKPPLSPRDPYVPMTSPRNAEPPPLPAFAAPPFSPPPLYTQPILPAPSGTATQATSSSGKSALAALAAFEDSFASFDMGPPKPAAAAPAPVATFTPASTPVVVVAPTPVVTAPAQKPSGGMTETERLLKQNEDEMAALAALLASVPARGQPYILPVIAPVTPHASPSPSPVLPVVVATPPVLISPQPTSANTSSLVASGLLSKAGGTSPVVLNTSVPSPSVSPAPGSSVSPPSVSSTTAHNSYASLSIPTRPAASGSLSKVSGAAPVFASPGSPAPGIALIPKRNNDFLDLDAQFAQLNASLNSLAADPVLATRPKASSSLSAGSPAAAVPVSTSSSVSPPSAVQNRAPSPSLPSNSAFGAPKSGSNTNVTMTNGNPAGVGTSAPVAVAPRPESPARAAGSSVSASILSLNNVLSSSSASSGTSGNSFSSSPAIFNSSPPGGTPAPAQSYAAAAAAFNQPPPSQQPAPVPRVASPVPEAGSVNVKALSSSFAVVPQQQQAVPEKQLSASLNTMPPASLPPTRAFSPAAQLSAQSISLNSSGNTLTASGKRDQSPTKFGRTVGPIVPKEQATVASSPNTSGSPASGGSNNPWMAKINEKMPGKINSPFFKPKAAATGTSDASPKPGDKSPRPMSPRSPQRTEEERKPASAINTNAATVTEPPRSPKPTAFKAKPMPVVAAPTGGAADLLFGDDVPGSTPFAPKKDNDLDQALADLLN